MSKRYEGPRCYVPRDEFVENPDGTYTKVLAGGWHYSTRIDKNSGEVPDKKLHLNNDDPDEANWFYEIAEDHHESWAAKHGPGNPVTLTPVEG